MCCCLPILRPAPGRKELWGEVEEGSTASTTGDILLGMGSWEQDSRAREHGFPVFLDVTIWKSAGTQQVQVWPVLRRNHRGA